MKYLAYNHFTCVISGSVGAGADPPGSGWHHHREPPELLLRLQEVGAEVQGGRVEPLCLVEGEDHFETLPGPGDWVLEWG